MISDELLTANQPLGPLARPSAGGASSAGEASLAPDQNGTPINFDRSVAAEEVSNAFSKNTPSQNTAPATPNTDSVDSVALDDKRASAGPSFRGKIFSRGQKLPPPRQAQVPGTSNSQGETSTGLRTV